MQQISLMWLRGDLKAVIGAIGDAKQSIEIGTVWEGVKRSTKFDAIGSTAAMKTVTDTCKLGGAG